MPDELWTKVHDIVRETGRKTIPKKKKCKRAKWLSEEALQIAVKREVKSKEEEERYTHLNAEFQRIARRDKKPSSAIIAKEQRKTIERQRPEIFSRILEIPREHLEKAMATHSSTFAWKIPWTEEPGRLQSMGSLRVRHD